MSEHTHRKPGRHRRSKRSRRSSDRYVTLWNGKKIRRSAYVRRIIGRVILLICFVTIGATLFKQLTDDGVENFQGSLEELMPKKVMKRAPLISTPEATTELSRLLNVHYASLPEAELRSFSFSGRYTSQGAEHKFETYARIDKSFRQTFRLQNKEFSASYYDSQYAEYLEDTKLERELEDVQRVNPYSLALESGTYSLVWAYKANGLSSLRLLTEDVLVDGVSCRVIESTWLFDFPVKHYIDPETGLELRRTTQVVFPNITYLVEISLDYRELGMEASASDSDGRYLVNSYTVEVDGTVYSTAEIESFRGNLGLTDWFFKLDDLDTATP